MILRNFYAWLYLAVIAQRNGNWSEVNNSLLDIDGKRYDISVANTGAHVARTQTFSDLSIHIGSGSEIPEYRDYCLSERITNISSATVSYARVLGDNHTKGVFIYSGTYSGTETITIREIGIIKNMYDSYGALKATILFTHTLLDNPITLQPGDGFSVQTELVIGADDWEDS